jgi:enoyl-[acyl-carrier protein] reductase II
MVLIPLIREVTNLPLIAAGGISSGSAMFAAMALGADGVQVGSRFAASNESSAHSQFKNKILDAGDGATQLALKQLVPVRLIKNNFYHIIQEAEQSGKSRDELMQLLGRGRAKKGMFEGDLEEGELEIGQVSALIHEIKPAAEIIRQMISEFNQVSSKLKGIHF